MRTPNSTTHSVLADDNCTVFNHPRHCFSHRWIQLTSACRIHPCQRLCHTLTSESDDRPVRHSGLTITIFRQGCARCIFFSRHFSQRGACWLAWNDTAHGWDAHVDSTDQRRHQCLCNGQWNAAQQREYTTPACCFDRRRVQHGVRPGGCCDDAEVGEKSDTGNRSGRCQ
jgi:hypothetical protein